MSRSIEDRRVDRRVQRGVADTGVRLSVPQAGVWRRRLYRSVATRVDGSRVNGSRVDRARVTSAGIDRAGVWFGANPTIRRVEAGVRGASWAGVPRASDEKTRADAQRQSKSEYRNRSLSHHFSLALSSDGLNKASASPLPDEVLADRRINLHVVGFCSHSGESRIRMPTWSPPALGAAVFIALHYLFLRAASGRLEDRLGALILEATATLGIALTFALGLRSAPVATTRWGMVLAASSGLAISFASILLFAALRRGGPVGATGTIALGGGVVLSAIAAPWLFGEEVTLRRVVGICLGLAAMAVLSRE